MSEVRGYLGKGMDSCFQLMELMNKDETYLSDYDVDLLLYWSMEYPAFHPSDNVFQEVMQTGRLGLLRDDGLKDNLFDWERKVENSVTEMEVFLKFKYEQYLPY